MSELRDFVDRYLNGDPIKVALEILKPNNRVQLDAFVRKIDEFERHHDNNSYSLKDKLKFAIHLQTLGVITHNFAIFDKYTTYVKSKISILKKDGNLRNVIKNPELLSQFYINEVLWYVKLGQYAAAFSKLKQCLSRWGDNNTQTQALQIHLTGLNLFNHYATDTKPHLDNKSTWQSYMKDNENNDRFEVVYWKVEYLMACAEYHLLSKRLKRANGVCKLIKLQTGLDLLKEAISLANSHKESYYILEYDVIKLIGMKIEHYQASLEIYKSVEVFKRCLSM